MFKYGKTSFIPILNKESTLPPLDVSHAWSIAKSHEVSMWIKCRIHSNLTFTWFIYYYSLNDSEKLIDGIF